jgi:biotin-dependent carboxylase-like uncharacterized protein
VTGPDPDSDPAVVEVRRPGALTTIQDRGRPGHAHLGVPRSGALDPVAHRRANRLVGNAETVPVLETTLDGVTLSFTDDRTVAVTGAWSPLAVDGRAVDWSMPVRVRAGQTLEVGRARLGVRSYVAFSGGIDVTPVLGSASTDVLSGMGPPPLASGDLLRLGVPHGSAAAVDLAPYPLPGGPLDLPVHPGPRLDWLSEPGRRVLTTGSWTVSTESNRTALRLSGPPVGRSRSDELPSEGIVLGAIQSLPDGQLVVFLADHPTTGGYPVVAVVDPGAVGSCAQAGPGTPVTFRPVGGQSGSAWSTR